MTPSKLSRLAALAVLILAVLLGACASTGSGATGTASPAAAKATESKATDYRQEMGENGLPTPRALLARFVDATGGEEAMKSIEATTLKGKMKMPAMGMEGDLVIKAKAPNKMVMNVEMAGVGSMNTGYDGTHGWSDNPMTGPQLLEGRMLTEMKRQADLFAQLNYDDIYPEQETLEQLEFDGRQAYKVRLADAEGNETFQYFDVDTAYLIGTEGTQASDMGEMEVSTVIGEYKDFGDVKIATSTVAKMMGMEIQQSVDEVSFEPLDDAAFTPPAAIQKLIDSQE